MRIPLELFAETRRFPVGQLVVVNHSHGGWRLDWHGEYRVVGVQWDYRRPPAKQINISIASEDDIERELSAADDFGLDDLLPIAEHK